jgi:predicted DNA-binding transcriptional regulator YafY
MSHHKQGMVRIRIINECLSIGGFWPKEKLIAKIAEADIEISPRSLDNDIALMRNCEQLKYYAPIGNDRKKGYYYTDADYSIDKIPLNDNDIKALNIATATLAQYKYLPLMQEFNTIIDRVIRVVNRAKQSNHESILDFIQFEKTPVAIGLENVDELIEAIKEKHVLQFHYQKFTSATPTVKTIHPYFLKEYRNRWYLIALDVKAQKIKTYGLDRIKSIKNTSNTYLPDISLNKSDFFKHCVGVNLMEHKIDEVELLFSSRQGHYLKSQKIHSSQNIVNDDAKGLLLSFRLIINYEFIGIILSYGSDVSVIKPESLANKIKEIADRISNQYN